MHIARYLHLTTLQIHRPTYFSGDALYVAASQAVFILCSPPSSPPVTTTIHLHLHWGSPTLTSRMISEDLNISNTSMLPLLLLWMSVCMDVCLPPYTNELSQAKVMQYISVSLWIFTQKSIRRYLLNSEIFRGGKKKKHLCTHD